MLSRRGNDNLQMMKEWMNQYWHSNVEMGELEILNAPFDMFNLYLTVYGDREVRITYDRSLVNLEVKQGNAYEDIRRFLKAGFIDGFASSEKVPFLHNLKILDTYLCARQGEKEV